LRDIAIGHNRETHYKRINSMDWTARGPQRGENPVNRAYQRGRRDPWHCDEAFNLRREHTRWGLGARKGANGDTVAASRVLTAVEDLSRSDRGS